MPNPTNITPPRVPFLDPVTNTITREWYRFFLSLFRTVEDNIDSESTLTPQFAADAELGAMFDAVANAPQLLSGEIQQQLDTLRQELQTLPQIAINSPVTQFTSTLQTLPAGNSAVTVSHGGVRAPNLFSVVARRNSTAAPGGTVDASYAADDEVQINGPDVISANTTYSVWSNATQLGYVQSTNPPSVTFKGGGNNGNISGTYWGLIFYCIWL